MGPKYGRTTIWIHSAPIIKVNGHDEKVWLFRYFNVPANAPIEVFRTLTNEHNHPLRRGPFLGDVS